MVTATDRTFAVLKGNYMTQDYALPISQRLKLTAVPAAATSRGVLRPLLISALLTASSALAQVPPPSAPPVPPPSTGNETTPKPITNPATPPTATDPATTPAAQPAPAVPPAVPTPAVQPVPLPGPGPRPNNAPVPLTNNQPRAAAGTENIYIQNENVLDVLDKYAEYTKRKLIYSNQLVGNIYIHVKDVTPEEWPKIIELSLAMNGFFIVPTDDKDIWRVTGVGQSPKGVGVPFIDREELLPLDEQVVMYHFKVKWADPTELAQTLAQGVLVQGANNPYSSIIPVPKAGSLLVTENTFIIRKLISIVRAIDVEPVEVESKFYILQHAQAEEVVTSLEKLFEKTQTTTTATAPGAPPRPSRTFTDGAGANLPNTGGVANSPEPGPSFVAEGGVSGIGPNEENIIIGKVKITADKRTNRIHVVTRKENWKLINMLIEEYDADVKLPDPLVRQLRYRPVEEIIDALVSAIKDPGEKDGAGGTGTSATGQRPGTNTQNQNQFNQNTGQNRFNNTTFDNTGSGSSGGAGSLGESLSTQERQTQPIAQQVGKSTIIADTRNNAIVVVGTADVKQKVSALLDELDVRQKQVLIEVVIGELRLNHNESFGVEYLLQNGGALTGTNNGPTTGTDGATTGGNSLLGFTTGAGGLNANNLLNQQAITRALNLSGSGANVYLAAGDAFNAIVNALESNGKFRVITKPRIFTINGKRAVITSGEEVPVPAQTTSGFGGTGNQLQTSSSIQFKPIELRLEVLPLINSDKEVSLEIVQNISERAGTTIIDNNPIVNVSRRALKTNITVPNNGTIILGGLIKESNDVSKAGLPGLSKLPVLGWLFGKQTKDKLRSELIILMRPVVTTSPLEDAQLREKTFESYNIPPDLGTALDPIGNREELVRPRVIKMGSLPTPRVSIPVLRDDGRGAARRR